MLAGAVTQTACRRGSGAATSLPAGVALALELTVTRAGGGPTERLAPGGHVAPGDTMHVELTSAQAGYVAVVGLTDEPSVKIFTPSMKPAIHLLGPGKTALPDAIVADGRTGKQRIVALVCPTETPPLMLNLAARRAALSHPHLDDISALSLPCAQAGISLETGPLALFSGAAGAAR